MAQIHLGALRRQHLAAELLVLLGRGESVGAFVTHLLASVVLLAVEDGGMLHGARYARFPVIEVGAVQLLRSVGIGQLQHSAESALRAPHLSVARGDDLVRPPARGDLRRELILGIGAALESVGYVVSERAAGLQNVGESRFEELLAHGLAVQIELIDAQTRGHPLGGSDLSLVLHGRHEPARAVGRAAVVAVMNDRGIHGGYPFGRLPSRRVESVGLLAHH